MLLPLFMLLSSQPVATPSSSPRADPDPPVRVWMSSDGNYALGDHAKVYARAAQDGYLVVLHAAPDGRVRVLFPLDPQDDQRVQGRKKYELKGRGGHEAFMVDDSSGHGTVLAAVAKAPFRFDQFEQNGRWDYQAFSDSAAGSDHEAGLMGIVQRMEPADGHFDFDVATYVAWASRYARDPYPYDYPLWWGYGPRFGFGFGGPYYWGYGRRWGRWHW
jgi:hypothetical protein